jgi:MFS family permease
MSIQLAFLDAAPVRKGGMATVVFAGSVGTIIEWYDFFIYGTAAALVFNTLFFPNIDPLTGTLASLATFSVGFIARPIGGAIFGHFGDRIGRKVMLMITMVIMALATFAVGCLPTYQEIGVWASILLVMLRFIQGICVGGEWGGASLMVIEHAPAARVASGSGPQAAEVHRSENASLSPDLSGCALVGARTVRAGRLRQLSVIFVYYFEIVVGHIQHILHRLPANISIPFRRAHVFICIENVAVRNVDVLNGL